MLIILLFPSGCCDPGEKGLFHNLLDMEYKKSTFFSLANTHLDQDCFAVKIRRCIDKFSYSCKWH